MTSARGVQASTPAYRERASLSSGGATTTVLALNGPAAARIVPPEALAALGPGTSAAGAAGLLRQIGQGAGPRGTVLPGRPPDLVVSARLSGVPAGSPVLSVQLTDAAGVGYLIEAGPLPADGRVHQLTVPIAAGADYPVRLRGFVLEYQEPLATPAAAALTIGPVSAGRPASVGSDSTAVLVPVPVPGPALESSASAIAVGPGTTDPAVTATRRTPGAVTVTFRTGSGTSVGQQGGTTQATLAVSAGPRVATLPGIATAAFLAATGQHLGGTVSVPVQGTTLPVRLAGVVGRFPTLGGPGGGLIIDQAALQDALAQQGIQPAPVSEWWLRTAGPAPAIRGLPGGTSVASAATVATGLRAQPLSAAGQEELLAVAVVALILAGAGFAVGRGGRPGAGPGRGHAGRARRPARPDSRPARAGAGHAGRPRRGGGLSGWACCSAT